jgi:predicted ATP-dependent serine protease
MAEAAVKSSMWLDLAAVLEGRRNVGTRFPTGLPSLDAKIEGGLYAGTLTVVQGKPGIGKTMLATQIALHLADKCAVACLYADEGMQGSAIRIGQQLGIPRAALMTGEGVPEATKALNGSPFFRFLDPSRPESTVEFMFAEFDAMAPPGLQRVFLVDSAQVVRSLKVTARLDRRQAVSTLLVELRDLALRYRAIVLVVSQVGRGSYRSKNEDERSDPLAAGLESSAIEFMADLILHLDGKPTKEDPAVKLRCPKNRLSAEGSFELPLLMDYPRARFLEADLAQIEADEVIARETVLKKAAQGIRAFLLADFPDGASTRAILAEGGTRRGDVICALRAGVGLGLLVRLKKPGRGGGILYVAKI